MNGHHKIQMCPLQLCSISEAPCDLKNTFWRLKKYTLVSSLHCVERVGRKFLKLPSAVQLPYHNIAELASLEHTSRKLGRDLFGQYDTKGGGNW